MDEVKYHFGFGNWIQSESLPGLLPKSQNSPQRVSENLVAEQFSTSAFTQLRHRNRHTWLYRKYPSTKRKLFKKCDSSPPHFFSQEMDFEPAINPVRFLPPNSLASKSKKTFLSGLTSVAASGFKPSEGGCHIATFEINTSQRDDENQVFQNNDGEILLLVQSGTLQIITEMGVLEIPPLQLAVIPAGIIFQVNLLSPSASGYFVENLGLPFELPELGVIGANGLANPRHFFIPKATAAPSDKKFQLIAKYHQSWYVKDLENTPFDVAAWSGNSYPYGYDLKLFNTIGSISFDHPDPSIFTVLTSPSPIAGIANLDFVIFPERYMCAEHTFRPPYFHRNVMSEAMGNLLGVYDAKVQGGFPPMALSIHNAFAPHGPDDDSYQAAIKEDLRPVKYKNTLSFMVEGQRRYQVCKSVLNSSRHDSNYHLVWGS